MNTSSVSIYIPTKNRLQLLKRAIQSALDQNHKNIEIVVASDGSTDGTNEYLLETAKSQPIIPIILTSSQGACNARNLAIQACTGNFITGLDDDDYFLPFRISTFLDAWSHEASNECSALFDSVLVINKQRVSKEYFTSDKVTHSMISRKNLVGNQIFTTKAALSEVGFFDKNLLIWQDWELWIRFSKRFGAFKNIHSRSMVIDQSHESDRVSRRPAETIFQTIEYITKQNCLTKHERAHLWLAATNYEQVLFSNFPFTSALTPGTTSSIIFSLLKNEIKNFRRRTS